MKTKTRLAIAGFGLIGRQHAKAIGESDHAELVAVIDPSETGQKAGADLGAKVFADLDQFFGAGGADGILLATPNTLHVEQGLQCVEQGIPMLIEKPIATRSSDAWALVERAKQQDVPLIVGHHRRHSPLMQSAKTAIEDGKIGDIRAVQAMCWLYKPDSYFDEADWRKKPGAGPIAVNLVHDIDLLRYLCGDVKTVRAVASPSLRGYQNEDVASALLEFESGAIGTITVSDSIVSPWSWELTARENPAYPPQPESCYLVGGSHGSLSIPDMKLWSYGENPRHWWHPLGVETRGVHPENPLVKQVDHFVEVIQKFAKPLVSGEEATKSLLVVEAIQRAAQTGETVRIDQGGF